MTQEEKQLLLKDLCARLPYGVKGRYCLYDSKGNLTDWGNEPEIVENIDLQKEKIWTDDTVQGYYLDEFKMYLRSMSSMTEEELREFAVLKFKNDDVWEIDEFLEMKFGFKGFINIRCRNRNNGDTWIYQVNTRTPLETYWGIDWLNAHHFDYRGLIEKGLALEAKEGMYKTE